MREIILATGTIAPPVDARALARADVDDRIADYRGGVGFCLERLHEGPFDAFVFVDNSGYGVAPFENLVKDEDLRGRIEMHSYDGMSEMPAVSRFFGECALLKEAFRISDILRSDGPARVWKVTGRYRVRNLDVLARKTPHGRDFYVHCRNQPTRFVDFGVAAFDIAKAPAVIETIMAACPDRRVDERVLIDFMDKGVLKNFSVSKRFPAIPDFSGVRGKDGKRYDDLSYRIKYALRVAANRVAPQLWI